MILRLLPVFMALSLALPAAAYQSVPAVNPLSREPLYAGLVSTAEQLKTQTAAFTPSVALLSEPSFQTYLVQVKALSDGDMKGHLDLKARGTDRDLKCILMGVSLDLGNKIKDVEAAKTDSDMATALGNMESLLGDNIDVIVTPDTADSGLDCVIEFGDR